MRLLFACCFRHGISTVYSRGADHIAGSAGSASACSGVGRRPRREHGSRTEHGGGGTAPTCSSPRRHEERNRSAHSAAVAARSKPCGAGTVKKATGAPPAASRVQPQQRRDSKRCSHVDNTSPTPDVVELLPSSEDEGEEEGSSRRSRLRQVKRRAHHEPRPNHVAKRRQRSSTSPDNDGSGSRSCCVRRCPPNKHMELKGGRLCVVPGQAFKSKAVRDKRPEFQRRRMRIQPVLKFSSKR